MAPLAVDVEAPHYEQALLPDTYGGGDPATYGLPLALYERMREQAPCVKLRFADPLLVDELWVVSRHADVSRVASDVEFFDSHHNPPTVLRAAPIDPVHHPALILEDGEEHRTKRRTIGKAFRPTNLHRLEERFRLHAESVVDSAVAKGSFDFITEVAYELPVRALGDVLGVPEEDRADLFRWVDAFVSPYDARIAPSHDDAAKALTDMWEYALQITQRKRAEPADDVFSILASMDIPDNEIQGNVAMFAGGAAETTRTALGHGMRALLDHPEQMAWMRERREDVPTGAIHEIVRIGAPIVTVLRTAAQDVELHGEVIREGDLVSPLFPSANFDPAAIPDPRRFDLSREPNDHLGFGRGSHSCLGKHVAVFEIKILFETLLERTKEIRPAGPIEYVRGNISRGVYSLPVEVTPA